MKKRSDQTHYMQSIRWPFEHQQVVTVTKGYNPPSIAEQAAAVLRDACPAELPRRKRKRRRTK